MRVAVIGAGFAGLATARVLRALGHQVVVHEKTPDVGGVWSRTRRYPGLMTQNDKGTYALSDAPMPASYPEWPSGRQVQEYLAAYVETHDLEPLLRLGTEVTLAAPADGGGWWVTTADGTERYDHLVVASGVFSEPRVPRYPGAERLADAGARLLPASELHDLQEVAGRHVVVVGYGKSACDVAVEVATVAASTTVVARRLLWKMTRRIRGSLSYKYVVLTRFGESLFPYRSPGRVERLLQARGGRPAAVLLRRIERETVRRLRLDELGLVPSGTFADIASSSVSLVTEGFFEAVAQGRITVCRDEVIDRFEVADGRAFAVLGDGRRIPADVVLAATGWTQDLPFLPADVLERLTDRNGDYLLYRQILPLDVPVLTFAGFNSSLLSPLSAEMSAVWIGSLLGGHHTLPDTATMRSDVTARLAWSRARTGTHHARGTNVIPFSLHNIDELLGDVGIDVGPLVKARQWVWPVDPSAYRFVLPTLVAQLGMRGGRRAATG